MPTVTAMSCSSHSPSAGESFMASECVSCGACVQACPTSALQEKTVIALGPPERTVLHLVTGPDAARAGDALGRVEGEIGVALVLGRVEVVLAPGAVTDLGQPHRLRHGAQVALTLLG